MAQAIERRKEPRRQPRLPQSLTVTTASKAKGSRTLAAKLVDFSPSGVGVEMFVPLRVGSLVSIEGNLRSEDLSLALNGRARVVHSGRRGRGTYRIGLALEEVAYRKSA